jgi:RNA polymerase sigma-70 factor (ECF subfamily)
LSNGGEDPWRAWLDRHGPALLLYARQWCRSRADGEDAVQDGFVRFWKSRGRARDDTAYLFACVRTAALDLSRAGERRRRHEAAVSVFENAPEHDDLREAVEIALKQLPVEQREVLVMKIWGGLTFAQIADVLAIPGNTAASRYRYALERLEATLATEASHD